MNLQLFHGRHNCALRGCKNRNVSVAVRLRLNVAMRGISHTMSQEHSGRALAAFNPKTNIRGIYDQIQVKMQGKIKEGE